MILFITQSIRSSMAFLYGSLGEIITEKSGHLNLGIPGIMCGGVAGGCLGVYSYMSMLSDPANPNYMLLILFGLLFAFIVAAFLGTIYAFLTVSLKCNQNVTGLALTIFGGGFTDVIMKKFETVEIQQFFSTASAYITKPLPFASGLGWFGEIFLSYGLLVYLAIALAVIAGVVLKKTKVGLRLRAVGENPAAADAVGINVSGYKYGATLIGAGISGIGGFFYVMDVVNGKFNSYAPIETLGWLAVALVIFTLWRPNLSILGSILFGILYTVGNFLSIQEPIPRALVEFVPYVATVLVLIVISIVGNKNVQPPASLGLNYFREER